MRERFRVSPEAVANRMGDEVVLVHVGTDRIFELNSSAARMWELISAGHGREEIRNQICEEFQITPELAAQQTEEFLSTLISEKIISISSE
jgi:coenzyme PQQ synthesis protein D (PqqD)